MSETFKHSKLIVHMGAEEVTVTVARSAGADEAVVVFIDTNFEPDGSDRERGGGPGLRVLVNDDDTYIGVPYVASDESEVCTACGVPYDDPGHDSVHYYEVN